MKKSSKIALIVVIIILIIGGIIGAYFIINGNKKEVDTVKLGINSNGKSLSETQKELIDETKMKDIINKSLIDIAKKEETSSTGYYAKYFELGRVDNGNNVDVYVWAQYGTTYANKKEQSGTSVPVKLTISLSNYSLVNSDVPPDDTNYMTYFPAVKDKLDGIEYKNKDALYGEIYYSK